MISKNSVINVGKGILEDSVNIDEMEFRVTVNFIDD